MFPSYSLGPLPLQTTSTRVLLTVGPPKDLGCKSPKWKSREFLTASYIHPPQPSWQSRRYQAFSPYWVSLLSPYPHSIHSLESISEKIQGRCWEVHVILWDCVGHPRDAESPGEPEELQQCKYFGPEVEPTGSELRKVKEDASRASALLRYSTWSSMPRNMCSVFLWAHLRFQP